MKKKSVWSYIGLLLPLALIAFVAMFMIGQNFGEQALTDIIGICLVIGLCLIIILVVVFKEKGLFVIIALMLVIFAASQVDKKPPSQQTSAAPQQAEKQSEHQVTSWTFEYVVQEHDTILGLAQKFDVLIPDIIKANNWPTPPPQPKVGDIINIPY